MQSGAIVPRDTHSAMNEATEKKPRTRTDWEAALCDACQSYETATSRRIKAMTMTYPASPALYVQVDDKLPVGFASAKDATQAVNFWASAP
jgi:hypothetical protein